VPLALTFTELWTVIGGVAGLAAAIVALAAIVLSMRSARDQELKNLALVLVAVRDAPALSTPGDRDEELFAQLRVALELMPSDDLPTSHRLLRDFTPAHRQSPPFNAVVAESLDEIRALRKRRLRLP
jgi:hypothetical protein